MSTCKLILFTVVVALTGSSVAIAQKGKGGKDNDVEALKAEVDRLRADLNAALREIEALKAAVAGGKAEPTGPLYRGRTAQSWLEQLKDVEPKSRIDALEALGALASGNKNLVPPIVEATKSDNILVASAAVKALGAAGSEALPALIDMAKDSKELRIQAITEITKLGPSAESAVPVLVSVLDNSNVINELVAATIALYKIGPRAKSAIPSLVNLLGKSLEDIGMPEKISAKNPQIRFGIYPTNLNVRIMRTIQTIDPALAKDLASPFVTDSLMRVSTPEEQEQWRAFHAALVKRIEKAK